MLPNWGLGVYGLRILLYLLDFETLNPKQFRADSIVTKLGFFYLTKLYVSVRNLSGSSFGSLVSSFNQCKSLVKYLIAGGNNISSGFDNLKLGTTVAFMTEVPPWRYFTDAEDSAISSLHDEVKKKKRLIELNLLAGWQSDPKGPSTQ